MLLFIYIILFIILVLKCYINITFILYMQKLNKKEAHVTLPLLTYRLYSLNPLALLASW